MTRAAIPLLSLLLPSLAAAVPAELLHTGRLLDAEGVPLEGEHTVAASLHADDTGALWTDTFTAQFDNGFFAIRLGSAAALDAALFERDHLELGLAIDGAEPLPVRFSLASVPWAIRANTATNVSGGIVNATEIQINGTTVINGNGAFVGTGGGTGGDGTSLDDLGCVDGDVPVFDGLAWTCAPLDAQHFHDAADITSGTVSLDRLPIGTSSDSVAQGDHTHGLSTLAGTLDPSQLPNNFGDLVDAAVTDGSLDLAAGTTIGGAAITTGPGYTDEQARAAMGAKANNNPLNHDRYTDAEAVVAMGVKGNTNSLNHDRYTNAEAVSAMGAKANTNALNHDRYTNAEAVAAMGAKANTNPLNHDRYTDTEAVAAMGAKANTNPLNHDRYTNAEAVTAVQGASTLALTGALTVGGATTLTGALTANGGIANRSWRLVSHEHFAGGASGWSDNYTLVCGTYGRILGPNFASGSAQGNRTKTYTNLPAHTELKIELEYHFLDSWDGEAGVITVDGSEAWRLAKGHTTSTEYNACGTSTWSDLMGVPVEITRAHTASSTQLTIGSTLDQAMNDEGWGVSHVRIYVR